MTARADQVEQTRQRIIEAAVALHGTVGPARTTIAAIAERAGVTRLTVYRHFADADALFAACTAHWAAQQRMPAPDSWSAASEPDQRLRVALADVYRFFAEAEPMLSLSLRDLDALPEWVRASNTVREAAWREAVLAAWPVRQRTATRRALVGHALSFTTWRSLCHEHGLTERAAIDAMVRSVG